MELRAPATIAAIAVNFLQNVRSWVLLPAEVSFRWSADGLTWSTPMAATHDAPANREGVVVHTFAANVASPAAVRFIRVSARAGGVLPIGHPGAGQPAWLFADEVIVRARRAGQ